MSENAYHLAIHAHMKQIVHSVVSCLVTEK